MSTTVDSRVLEMRFDNKHFESNVSTTMSTLDKLKAKLNLPGASKGLENINTAAKNVNMTGLGAAVDTVRTKFSALEVMGVTALANITNSAVNAGKRMISALTIDPIKTGFQEYETQINATQTILANVGHKGKTLEDVNNALEELNKYADKTIYNFTEMTKNIGLFTNAGVGLDESVSAIKGFSNAAAMAGTDATRTAGAMYQLSQAMSSGVVQLMDWRSLEQANITGERFQETIKMTARAHGIAIDDMIAKQGNFRNTLKDGWLTADLMAEALNHYTLSTETMTEAEIKANRERLKSLGYTEEQIDKLFELGTEANNAATKVKTFSQLWDVLKESAQSGWSKTWKLIIGDFEQAKNFITPLAETLTGFLDRMSKARNDLIESSLGRGFKTLSEKIQTVIKPAIKAADSVKTVVEAVKDYGAVVDEIINGKWGNGQERWDKLTKAGYDWAHAQNLVNEKLGVSLRRETQYKEAQEKTTEVQTKLNETEAKRIGQLANMSEAQLRALNFTEPQIKAFKELKEAADKLGLSVEDFVANIDEIDGRWLILNSFKNAGKALGEVFTTLKQAWIEIFPPKSLEERSEGIFNIIAAIHKFSTTLGGFVDENGKLTEKGDKLKRTFKGVFAALKIVSTILAGPLKIGFELISAILKYFDVDVLTVTAAVGDALVAFSNWIDIGKMFEKVIAKVGPYLKDAAEAIREWWASFKEGNGIPDNIISGLANGIKSGVPIICNAMFELAKGLWESFCDFMKINSPSKKMEEGGEYAVQGLVNGLQNGVSKVGDAMGGLASKCIEVFKSIDWGGLFAASVGVGFLVMGFKLIDAVGNLTEPLEGIGEVFEGFSKRLKASATNLKAEALFTIAKAIAVLVASLILLTMVDPVDLAIAGGALLGIMIALGSFMAIVQKIDLKDAIDIGKFALLMISISASLLIVAAAVKKLAGLDPSQLKSATWAVAGIAVIIAGLIWATKLFNKDATKIGTTLLGVSAAILLLALVMKMLGSMEPADMIKGGACIAGFAVLVVGLIWATKLFGSSASKVGSNLLKMVGAIALLILVAKIVSRMDPKDLLKGGLIIAVFGALVAGLITITRIAGGNDLKKVGTTLLAITVAIGLLAYVAVKLSEVDTFSLVKGMVAVAALSSLVVGLVAVTKFVGGNDLKGVAVTLLSMSVAIGILAGVTALLGFVDTKHLVKGIIAVGILAGLIALLAVSTRGAQDCSKNLIVMTVAIGLLVASLIGLSFLDPKKLATASASLSAVIGMFALLVAATRIGGKNTASVKQLLPLLGVAVVLGGIVAALAFLPNPDAALKNTAALSILMLAFSASLAIMSYAGQMTHSATKALLPMTLIVAGLAAILGTMSYLNVEASIGTALAIGVLLNAMAAAMAILNYAGPNAMKGVGAMVLLGLVVAELAAVLGLMAHFDVQPSIEVAGSLSTLLLAMSGALVILGVVGMMGPAAFIGIGALATLIAALGVILAALGGLSKIDGFNQLIKDGGETLSLIGYALGKFVGSIVGGFTAGAVSGLPEIGTLLSQFMTNVTPFVEGVKTVDKTALTGIATLTGAILALTAADVITGMMSWRSGGVSFAELGTELSDFVTNASSFINNASAINADVVSGVKALAETVLILTAADIIQGLTSWFAGGSSIADFGKQLPQLGTDIGTFASNLGSFDESKATSVKCAGEAIKAIAEAATSIPNEGGLAALFAGENSIAAFAGQLPSLGSNLSWFAKNLDGFNETHLTSIKCAATAIKEMAIAAEGIPNEGGLAALFAGENSISAFGGELPSLGSNLSLFASNLGTFDDAKVATIKCAADAIVAMAKASEGLDGQAGWAKALFGDDGIGAFSGEFKTVGANLKGFADNLGTFGADKVATVRSAVNAIKAFTALAGVDLKGAKKQIDDFGGKLPGFAKDIAKFCNNLPSTEGLKAAVDNLKLIASISDTITGANADAMTNFTNALKKLGTDSVTKFVAEFTSNAAKTNVKNAAIALADQVIKGFESKHNAVKSAATKMADKAVDGLDGLEADGKTAGKYLGSGLVNGINAKQTAAYNAGYALGQAAVQGELDGQASESPSKLTIQAGKWLGEGLIIGMDQMGRKVYSAGSEMGKTGVSSISSSIKTIADTINSDIDSQPTIRPVLDLDDLRAGTGLINGMFGMTPSVGLLTNVGSINTMMNRRNQNGANSDVIAALKDLKKSMENRPGDTYSFGNVTYGDDTAVSSAVHDLVRAIRLERRT